MTLAGLEKVAVAGFSGGCLKSSSSEGSRVKDIFVAKTSLHAPSVIPICSNNDEKQHLPRGRYPLFSG